VAAADFRKNILAVQGKQPGLAVAEGDPQEQTPPARRDQDGGQRPAQGQGGGGARRKPGPGGGPQRQGGKSGPAMAASVQVRPMAAPAQMKKRHWGLLVSFLALVVAPLAATVFICGSWRWINTVPAPVLPSVRKKPVAPRICWAGWRSLPAPPRRPTVMFCMSSSRARKLSDGSTMKLTLLAIFHPLAGRSGVFPVA